MKKIKEAVTRGVTVAELQWNYKCKCIYFTLLLTFVNMHIHLLLIHIFYFIMTGLRKCFFINVQGCSLEHIRDRLVRFIVSKVINRKGEFHFALCYVTVILCLIVN
jgi:hypothetical protein